MKPQTIPLNRVRLALAFVVGNLQLKPLCGWNRVPAHMRYALALGALNESTSNPFGSGKTATGRKHVAVIARGATVNHEPIKTPVMGVNFRRVEILNEKNKLWAHAGNVCFPDFGQGDMHGAEVIHKGAGFSLYLLLQVSMPFRAGLSTPLRG